jgi:RNA polymerase sigma-70 factor (ECF subfamily)
MMSRADLMVQYCEGESGAFEALYASVASPLRSFLRRLSRSDVMAEDLLQQTFLKAHRARGIFERGADPLPWLFTIARRVWLDESRRGRQEKLDAEAVENARADARLADFGRLADALDHLPEGQRRALTITKLEGKSVAEAAALLGATPAAVKIRTHRAYLALREALG